MICQSEWCDCRSVLEDVQKSTTQVLEKLHSTWKEISEGEDKLEVPSSKLRFDADTCHKLSNSWETIQHTLRFDQQENHLQAPGLVDHLQSAFTCYSDISYATSSP